MPDFYRNADSHYQPRAQPYLDAFVDAMLHNQNARAELVRSTSLEREFSETTVPFKEQHASRDPSDKMKQPFWANYWSEPCARCDCRPPGSKTMEIDALIFLRNVSGKVLAVHVEFKADDERLSDDQARAYAPRAQCYLEGRKSRKGVLRHDEFMTVLLHGAGDTVVDLAEHFTKCFTHSDVLKLASK